MFVGPCEWELVSGLVTGFLPEGKFRDQNSTYLWLSTRPVWASFPGAAPLEAYEPQLTRMYFVKPLKLKRFFFPSVAKSEKFGNLQLFLKN